MLRLGKEYTEDERKNRVDEILNFVRLEQLATLAGWLTFVSCSSI